MYKDKTKRLPVQEVHNPNHITETMRDGDSESCKDRNFNDCIGIDALASSE
jgi:hypothetical protein